MAAGLVLPDIYNEMSVAWRLAQPSVSKAAASLMGYLEGVEGFWQYS